MSLARRRPFHELVAPARVHPQALEAAGLAAPDEIGTEGRELGVVEAEKRFNPHLRW